MSAEIRCAKYCHLVGVQQLCFSPLNQDGQCRFKPDSIGATCTGFVDVTQFDEDALKEAVATVGPVSVGIDASQVSFQLYDSGEPFKTQTLTEMGTYTSYSEPVHMSACSRCV